MSILLLDLAHIKQPPKQLSELWLLLQSFPDMGTQNSALNIIIVHCIWYTVDSIIREFMKSELRHWQESVFQVSWQAPLLPSRSVIYSDWHSFDVRMRSGCIKFSNLVESYSVRWTYPMLDRVRLLHVKVPARLYLVIPCLWWVWFD